MTDLRNTGARRYTVPKDIQRLAPHLDIDEIDEIVREASDSGRAYFIGPPVKIRGAEHVYSLTQVDEDNERFLKIQWAGCHRRKESYVRTSVPNDWKPKDYAYRERVADHAEIHWGNNLVWDRGRQYIHYLVVDPTRRTRHHYPIIEREAMVSLSEPWVNLTYLQDRYPMPQLIEQCLELICDNIFLHAEIRGDSRPMVATVCKFCGGGIGLDHCHFCGRKVVCKKQGRIDWEYPIPLRICDDLQWMSSFETSPANAMKAYYGEWSMKDYEAPPTRAREAREQRSIVLRDDEA